MFKYEEILPLTNELPVDYADRLGLIYNTSVNQKHKKSKGQFFTPSKIARFMGNLNCSIKNNIRILDPGCGTGILTCALIEYMILNSNSVEHITLIAYETDKSLIPYTDKSLYYLKQWLADKGISFEFELLITDFILENAGKINRSNQLSLIDSDKSENFDFIICNPPYFKLPKDDIRVKATEEIVSGQINIYALFMAVSINLLNEDGQLVFITPRSFCSGNYFKTFRKFILSNIKITHIHLFNSRTKTFNRDNVLQETLILKGSLSKSSMNSGEIAITSSIGIEDIDNSYINHFNPNDIIDFTSKDNIIHLPVSLIDSKVIKLFKSWKHKLIDLNIQISTGPVVAFRSIKYINNNFENNENMAPLYWLHNVQKMNILWPVRKPNKGQFIRISKESLPILTNNKNIVLLRRFSAKGDKSRLVASPYFANPDNPEFIGIENKLNYIYKLNGNLEMDESVGLAALLNSSIFDIYFRTFNGSINVSATELRAMPLPPIDSIKEIGSELLLKKDYSQDVIDKIVMSYFKFDDRL